MIIKIISTSDFYTDQNKYRTPFGERFSLTRAHLPMEAYITCKKCLKSIIKIINQTP